MCVYIYIHIYTYIAPISAGTGTRAPHHRGGIRTLLLPFCSSSARADAARREASTERRSAWDTAD